jgi:hypothetical protein
MVRKLQKNNSHIAVNSGKTPEKFEFRAPSRCTILCARARAVSQKQTGFDNCVHVDDDDFARISFFEGGLERGRCRSSIYGRAW